MNPSRKTLIIIYLIFLVIFFWSSLSRQNAPQPAPVRLISDAKSYTLPKTPVISLVNETENPLSVNTCTDIEVVANGLQKTSLPESFCREVEVPAGTVTPLFGQTKEDILEFQKSFAEIEASLRFKYLQPDSETQPEVTINIGHAGIFRLFFRTFFYNPVYNLFVGLVLLVPGHSLGWAIIAITLIIRLALLIPQQKMLVSQRRMQVIQPKIKAIQEEFK